VGRDDDGIPTDTSTFVRTREALHSVACYAVSPARKAVTGHIDLRAADDGFATPPFPDGSRIGVRADLLVREPGDDVPITTVRAAAEVLGVALSPDPGVGRDLPPFAPDEPLDVDVDASLMIGRWYALASRVLTQLDGRYASRATLTEQKLWPEHFDLALEVSFANGRHANVGFSPGDRSSDVPYVYVGPFDRSGLAGSYWNAPFGAWLRYESLVGDESSAMAFITEGLALLAS
jgi:hypothetical protein